MKTTDGRPSPGSNRDAWGQSALRRRQHGGWLLSLSAALLLVAAPGAQAADDSSKWCSLQCDVLYQSKEPRPPKCARKRVIRSGKIISVLVNPGACDESKAEYDRQVVRYTKVKPTRDAIGTQKACVAQCKELLGLAGVTRPVSAPTRAFSALLHGEVVDAKAYHHRLVRMGQVEIAGTLALQVQPGDLAVTLNSTDGTERRLSGSKTHELPSGVYTVTAQRDRFHHHESTVRVPVAGTAALTVTLKPIVATIRVKAPGKVTVSVDGKQLAAGNGSSGGVVGGEVQIGRRSVTIAAEGYMAWTSTRTLVKGEALELDFPSCAGDSQISVTSDPSGASVQLPGGKTVGKTPLILLGFSSEISVKLQLGGYETASVRVKPRPGLHTVDTSLTSIHEQRFYDALSGFHFDRYPIGMQTLIFSDPATSLWNFGHLGMSWAWGNWRVPIFGFRWYFANLAMDQPGPSGHSYFFMFESLGLEYSGYGVEDLGSPGSAIYFRVVPVFGVARGLFNGESRSDGLYGGEGLIGWRAPAGWFDMAVGGHYDNLNGAGVLVHLGVTFKDGPQ